MKKYKSWSEKRKKTKCNLRDFKRNAISLGVLFLSTIFIFSAIAVFILSFLEMLFFGMTFLCSMTLFLSNF